MTRKPTAKIGVRRTRGGTVLVPLNPAAVPVIELLYFGPPVPMMPGWPVAKFLRHALEVARDLRIKVTVGGTARRPILKCIPPPPPPPPLPVRRYSVDLKWSLWSAHVDTWTEHAGVAVVDAMRAAFQGRGVAVEVATSPRKEIRHGVVRVTQGRAAGCFTTEWDSIDDLPADLGLPEFADDDERQAFAESIPFSAHALEPGLDRDFDVTADTFEALLARVDHEEAMLLAADSEAWAEVEAMYKKDRADAAEGS